MFLFFGGSLILRHSTLLLIKNWKDRLTVIFMDIAKEHQVNYHRLGLTYQEYQSMKGGLTWTTIGKYNIL